MNDQLVMDVALVSQALIPLGVTAIYQACRKLYPDQPNPLQVAAKIKYWLDGPDPLDYISMYANLGDASRGIPPHWHYISLGLSDLHGDGRVHNRGTADGPSGFGFELTFRLRRESTETAPPTWPAMLMQALARYIFQSDNVLQGGDHVSWHSPLDQSDSRIQHMLIAEDAQLSPIQSPFGLIHFVQIVGVCAEELKAAQHWNGPGVLELMRNISVAGGPWLITDMKRGETIFELDPDFQEKVEVGIEQEGSNLSGVSGLVMWEEILEESDEAKHHTRRYSDGSDRDVSELHYAESELSKSVSGKGKGKGEEIEALNDLVSSRKHSFDCDHPMELVRTRTLNAVHLRFNMETASLLPLALRGRIKHGRHFTFKSTFNDTAVTLVSPSVVGSIADEEHPLAMHGPWLQVLLRDDCISQLCQELDCLSDAQEIPSSQIWRWPEHRLTISISL